MTRFTVAKQSFVLPEAGLFCLPAEVLPPDDWADAVLAGLAPQAAWLPADGGLISNLSLLENALLPCRWRQAHTVAALNTQLEQALVLLGQPDDGVVAELELRPAQAQPGAHRLARYLRVLLAKPAVVVMGEGALAGAWNGEALTACWPRWLPDAILLSLGQETDWPRLVAVEGGA